VNFRADYLPLATALTGKRKFHLIDLAIADAAQLSLVALLAPNGLEALAHFDTYFDNSRICLNLQRTTSTAFAAFASDQGHDEQEIEMAGLTALFGFFSLAGS